MQVTRARKESAMPSRLAIGLGGAALAAALAVGSLEWMTAQAAHQQLEGAESPAVVVLERARPAPRRAVSAAPLSPREVAAPPRVDSSVERFETMRSQLGSPARF
jgi:hypothetical protein